MLYKKSGGWTWSASEEEKGFHGNVFIHHIVTIALVVIGMLYGLYIRIAFIIMVLFDAADPFLHPVQLYEVVVMESRF